MSNVNIANRILQACARAGVDEVVLCAGARNAPFVSALTYGHRLRTHSFFEERSAAFFALGRIQAHGRPVAVITTSGTAAAELLPATIEADYQRLPLVLITADRPKALRGTGAPQTIVQPGLFGEHVEACLDIEGEPPDTLAWSHQRPLHLNVCFDEPLLDAIPEPFRWPTLPAKACTESGAKPVSIKMKRPLVIVSGLPLAATARVREILKAWKRPVYLEGPSQMRGDPELDAFEILARDIPHLSSQIDGVIRIGSVPTLRYWRDLERGEIPICHFSQLPWPGLARERTVHPLESLAADWSMEHWQKPQELSAARARLEALLKEYPLSEPGWVRALSQQIPNGARVFLGNSLPIREWDLAAARGLHAQVFANRGVNGIDGLVSTFFGLCDSGQSNWALIGDLSVLYDLSGPWALQAAKVSDVNLVVINNGGGRIFQRMFHNPMFENPHSLNFEHWAHLWKIDYLRLAEPQVLDEALVPRIIEVVPDEAQTEAFWAAWEPR